MARSKAKRATNVVVKAESAAPRKAKSQGKRKIDLDESQKEKVASFCMVTRTEETVALKWLSTNGWASGTAMQNYFKYMQAACSDTVDLTADEDESKSNSGSTGGLGEILFNSHYGRFLHHVNRIDFEAKSDLTLPRVVVIGNESSGKSSTLERIAMFPFFPRDRDLCTRMPIKLCLRNDSAADPSTIKIKHNSSEQTVAVSEAAECISSTMQRIVKEKNDGKLVGIVDEELVVEVRNSGVPTLDLIDLPGIVAASISGEPTDMMNTTRTLVNRYILDQDTLVVAVIPANSRRIRDSQALQLVQKCNAQSRTIGVLTMPDLAYDPRRQQDPYWELKERLAGNAEDMVELGQGYVAVKNRDTLADHEVKIMGVGADELRWFEEHLPSFDPATQVGVGALLHKLDGLINSHLRTRWVPRIKQHIANRKTRNAEQLTKLGKDPQEMRSADLFGKLQTMPLSKKAMFTSATKEWNELCAKSAATFTIGRCLLDANNPATTNRLDLPASFPAANNWDTLGAYDRVCFRRYLLQRIRECSGDLLNDLKSRVRILLEKYFDDSSLPIKLNRFTVFKESVIACILQTMNDENQLCDSLTQRTVLIFDTQSCTSLTTLRNHVAMCLAEVVMLALEVVDSAPANFLSQLESCASDVVDDDDSDQPPSRKRRKSVVRQSYASVVRQSYATTSGSSSSGSSASIFVREDAESARARMMCKQLEASLVATEAVLNDIAEDPESES